jgi:hypothetical protein
MTSNTSPEKPDWFALIEKDAPSAQVRKIDKKIPAVTGFLAITIVALGAFFTNGSMSIDSSVASNSDVTSINTGTSINPGTSISTVASTDDEDEYEDEDEEEENDRD